MIFISQKNASKFEEEVDDIVSDTDKRFVEFIFYFFVSTVYGFTISVA